jgi:hypothetical protein
MGTKPAPRFGSASVASPAGAREVSYRSTQIMLALWVILPLTAITVVAVSWALPQPPWTHALVVAATLLPLILLGRLVIELRGGFLSWRYGFLGWPRWRIAIDEIVEIRPTRGPAAHAGIQFSGHWRTFTASLGSPALEFTLGDGRRIVLGSPEPERLAQFIRARLPTRR